MSAVYDEWFRALPERMHEIRDGMNTIEHDGYRAKWLQHDAGRSTSKRPKARNDCTVRAIAAVTGAPYDAAYEWIAAGGRKSGKRFKLKPFFAANVFLHDADWRFAWTPYPAVKGERRMNVIAFVATHPRGRYVIQVSKHVIAVVDGVLIDDHLPRLNACVYGAWTVGEML
jgi:hypothetical protein